jgi:hypothetical protein
LIAEFFLGLVTTMGSWLIGLLPPDDSADLAASASGIISTVVGNASGISVWFPWAVAATCALAVTTAWGALFFVKILRQLATHIPLFGGTG